MNVLNRFKMEISNQKYFSDTEYVQFLNEEGLNSNDEYDKGTMRKSLLKAVVSTLEAVTNDIDVMASIKTEFSDIGSAYKYLEQRIQKVKNEIASIPDNVEEEQSQFSLMFTNSGFRSRTQKTGRISKETIENLN